MVRGLVEVRRNNAEWIKDHFENHNKEQREVGSNKKKIVIEVKEVLVAMDKMGKNKAASIDELTDAMF